MNLLILIRGPPESSRTECPRDYHESGLSTITESFRFFRRTRSFQRGCKPVNQMLFVFPYPLIPSGFAAIRIFQGGKFGPPEKLAAREINRFTDAGHRRRHRNFSSSVAASSHCCRRSGCTLPWPMYLRQSKVHSRCRLRLCRS